MKFRLLGQLTLVATISAISASSSHAWEGYDNNRYYATTTTIIDLLMGNWNGVIMAEALPPCRLDPNAIPPAAVMVAPNGFMPVLAEQRLLSVLMFARAQNTRVRLITTPDQNGSCRVTTALTCFDPASCAAPQPPQ